MNRERENWGCSEREREERLEEGKPCHVPPRALFPSTQPPRAFLKGAACRRASAEESPSPQLAFVAYATYSLCVIFECLSEYIE